MLTFVDRDILVVLSQLRLCARCPEGFVKFLTLFVAFPELLAVHHSRLLVARPCRATQVSAYDAFDLEDLEATDLHCARVQLLGELKWETFCESLGNANGEVVRAEVWDLGRQVLEPKPGEKCEECALHRNALFARVSMSRLGKSLRRQQVDVGAKNHVHSS